MKSSRLVLMSLFATASAGAGAASSDARMHSTHVSFARHAAGVSGMDFSAQSGLSGGFLPLTTDMLLRPPAAARANFSDFSGDVIRDVRATSAFVRKQTWQARHDGRLITLAAIGLVVLQLRRKHKSLPQRRIAAYA